MSIVDDIRVKQDFDPTGENGGYKFEVVTKPYYHTVKVDIVYNQLLPSLNPHALKTLKKMHDDWLRQRAEKILQNGGIAPLGDVGPADDKASDGGITFLDVNGDPQPFPKAEPDSYVSVEEAKALYESERSHIDKLSDD